jgi:Mn-containing catalase
MAKAARFDRLGECFEEHLLETGRRIERLNECFSLLGESARARPCKGMMGLVEEGQEVMAERRKVRCPCGSCADRRDTAGRALRISGYTTAKRLAQQLR